MITPEGRVKAAIRKWLRSKGIYVFSPVQMGVGRTTLDDLCCVNGRFVAIEYKAPGGAPTPRQLVTMAEIRRAGGVALWGDNVEDIKWAIESLHLNY